MKSVSVSPDSVDPLRDGGLNILKSSYLLVVTVESFVHLFSLEYSDDFLNVVEKLELVCFALLESIACFVVSDFRLGHLVDRADDVVNLHPAHVVDSLHDALRFGRRA